MQEIRCKNCNKLLGKKYGPNNCTTHLNSEAVQNIGEIEEIDKDHSLIEIKCPRCKKINKISA